MQPEPKKIEDRIFLCHKSGMCPVLRVDGDSFLLEDDHQATPGKVRLDHEQARGLMDALKKLLSDD